MKDKVSSLKEAIDITLYKYKYDRNNTDIIKKLITNALSGNPNLFTRTDGARDYVNSLNNNGILKEMMFITQKNTTVDEIIESYIDKCFKQKDSSNVIENIKQNSDLEKIAKRIRFIDTTSESDMDFNTQLWKFFSRAFVGEETYLTKDELRYDMLEAALEKANLNRDNATVLKTIDPTSKDMTEMDAVILVEEYVYEGNIQKLMDYINSNRVLSGLLLQNLFDYTYFKKEEKRSKHLDLDYKLSNITHTKLKSQVLNQILLGDNMGPSMNTSREAALIDVIKNTLALSIYTNNKNIIDYDEKNLYIGTENITEEFLNNRINTNNQIVNNLLVKGMDTTVDDLAYMLNNLSINQIYFLANIYCISRSTTDNRNKLDNSIYYGTKEQTHLYNLLNDPRLLDGLQKSDLKKVA